jgi:uncharacterized membrane protein YkoI
MMGHTGLTARHLLSWLTAALILMTLVGTASADNRLGDDASSVKDRLRPEGGMDYEALRRELDSFKAAPVSLRKALAIAQRLHAGSRVLDISFDGTVDPPVYRVKTGLGDRVWQDAIDARSGSIAGPSSQFPTSDLQQQDQRMLFGLRTVRQEILDAVIVAERSTSGTAISAGLMEDAERLSFVVVCVAGGDLKQVILEPPKITSPERKRRIAR